MIHIPLAWALVLPAFAASDLPAACPRADSFPLQERQARLTRALALGAFDVEGLQLVQVKAGQWGGDWSETASLLTNVSIMTKAMHDTLDAVRASHRMRPALAEVPHGHQAAVESSSLPRSWQVPPGSVKDKDIGMRPSAASLTAQNARLRQETMRLREEMSRLHEQDAELRREDTVLRLEEAQLRHALVPSDGLPLLASRPTLFATGVSKMRSRRMTTVGLGVALGFAGLALFALLWCGACIRFQDEDDSDLEDEEDEYPVDREIKREKEHRAERKLKAMVKGRRHQGLCARCCCCCNPQLAMFLFVVMFFSVLLGAITWHLGLLQPIVAQLGAYAYIAAILVCFVGILIAELWRAVTTLIRYIMLEFDRFRGHFKTGMSRAKYTIRDFLDDGKLNQSVPVYHQSRRPRTNES